MNNVTLVSDHVLLPHQANWLTQPQLSRLWRSPVTQALTKSEDRLSVRQNSWLVLSYEVLPYNQIERARFDVRFKEGMKTGKLAVPFWGKGVRLAKDHHIGQTTLSLSRANHGFTSGQRLLVQSSVPAEFDAWDVCLISTVASDVLTIATALTNEYKLGTRVWPLLYGTPKPESFQVINSTRSRYRVEVQFDQRQINAFGDDTFENYALGDIVTPLNSGEGWSGPWVIGSFAA